MENEPGNENEREQSPAEIRAIIKEALEARSNIRLAQYTNRAEDGVIENLAEPIAFDGEYLLVESMGYPLSIDINLIKHVEISWEQDDNE